MWIQKALAVCATSGLTMFNVYLFVMLVWTAGLATAQQQSLTANNNMNGHGASAVLVDETRMRSLNGVTSNNRNRNNAGGRTRVKSGYGGEAKAPSNVDYGASSVDDEGYMREVKAIIGGVLGFWGGVGSLGTMFLVIVLSQRYCCRKDDDKDDADG